MVREAVSRSQHGGRRAGTDFVVGDEVFGELPHGGTFATFAAADARVLTRRPRTLDSVQAAAVPLAGVTALMAAQDKAAVSAGQRLLIIGASGGVGTFASWLRAGCWSVTMP